MQATWLVPLLLLAMLPSCSDEGNVSSPSDGGGNPSASEEVVVVTVNADQFKQDVPRLRMLSVALSDASIDRAPDVVLLQEIEADSVEVLSGLLEDEFPGSSFEPTGPLNRSVRSKVIVNVATNEVRNSVVWTDACDTRNRYLALRLLGRAGKEAYTVAGVHIPWDAPTECRKQNASLLRSTVEMWDGPSIAAGDFNQRAVVEQRECDLDETSDPQPWWNEMTSGEGSEGFADAVKVEAQRAGDPVGEQWTYEGIGPTTLCDGTTKFRRNRIDYIFVRGLPVLDAGADDPGWAGAEPGTFNCEDEADCRYSDHRFVWARLGLGG